MSSEETLADVMRQIGIYDASAQTRSPLQTAIQAPAIPNRNAPRNRPPPRQMRPAEQRAMDPNAGVRRQAMGQLERRAGADLATMPRTPRGNQFAEAGEMALEGTGLPSVRRGAETLTGVARNPSQPNAPMRALGGLGELGLGVLGAATFGEVGSATPRIPATPRPSSFQAYRAMHFPPDKAAAPRSVEYWSSSPEVADTFIRPPEATRPRASLTSTELVDGQYGEGANVQRTTLGTDNFLHIDAQGRFWNNLPQSEIPRPLRQRAREIRGARPRSIEDLEQAAREAGYDGIAVHNVIDYSDTPTPPPMASTFGVFNRRPAPAAPPQAATIGEFGGVRPRGRVPMREAPRAPAVPQSDPEALSLARSWIDSFGGGPSAEARAIEVMTEHMQEARNPAWRQRLADAIDSVGSRAYVQGERTSFSQRVEDAWPEIYGGAATPDPSPPLTRPPTRQNPYLDDLRAQGFDVDTPLYHGTLRDFDEFLPSENSVYGPSGRGVYLTDSAEEASLYAGDPKYRPLQYRPAEGGNVRPVYARGQFIDPLTDADGRMLPVPENVAGYRLKLGDSTEYIVRDPKDIAYRFGQAEPLQRITRPPTQIAPNGMPIRPPEPGRQSFVGGSGDLRGAAEGQFAQAPGIAPQQAPPRTSPRLVPSPNTPRPRPQAPAGTGDMQPEGIAGIRAYHGSPHDFDRFRWDETTRGTGEGAQAYGDGLYFGESEEVARTYRDTLTSRTGGLLDGQPLYSPTGGFRNDVARRIASELGDSGPGAVITLQRHGGDIDATIAEIRARWNQSDPATVQALEGLEALRPRIQRPKGHMYEVDINANPDDFIDLDLPMGQQSPRVRDYVSQVYDMPQGRPFNQLRYRPNAAEAESARKAGLAGYRFLDQGSRGVGSGSRNLVVIDDSLIEILRKYGIAGLTAGGAGAGVANQNQGPRT